MKKVFYLIGISTLFLFAACENEGITETINETKMYSPVVKGAIGDFSDATPTTKAGVIEDNEDFREVGEYFYWHSGDEALLLFFNNDTPGADPISRIYSTQFEETDKSKKRDFTSTEGVPEGNYTVYGLYPAAAWDLVGDFYRAELTPPDPLENLESSAYLGQNMLMKAKAENVEIGEGETNEFSLSYKHLGGVMRFNIRNSPDPDYDILAGLTLSKVLEDAPQPFFPAAGYLADLDDETLTSAEGDYINQVQISFADDVSGTDFDFFIPFISIAGFEEDEQLSFDLSFENDEGELLPMTPPFLTTELFPELANGFDHGFSYYFSITDWSILGGN